MEAYLISTACTKFEKKPDQTFKDLTKEVYCELLKSAKVENGDMIGQAWFGNCGMGTFGQNNIRGQVCFTPLVREKQFPERVGIIKELSMVDKVISFNDSDDTACQAVA